MPEAQSSNPFTNTRLMLAGIVCGVIGVVLAYWTINSRIEQATGGTTIVWFLKKDLRPDEALKSHHVDYRPMPDAFLKAATLMIKGKDIENYFERKPFRAMKEGEPLSVLDFPFDREEAALPKLRAGCVYRALKIDSKGDPGRGLRLGSTVSLTGNFDLAPERGGAPDEHTLRLFEKICVMMINGDPDNRSADKVTMVTVELSDEAARVLTQLMPRMRGAFYVDVHAQETLKSPPGQEIPSDVKQLIREKLGAGSIG